MCQFIAKFAFDFDIKFHTIMNKLLYLLTIAGILLTTACGDDNDDPTHGTVYNRTYSILNHVTDATTGNVLAVTSGKVNYKIDITNLTADVNFGVKLDGNTETPFSFSSVKVANPSYGIYHFDNATPAASITEFAGLIDFNEEATRFSFVNAGKYRICATLPEIFYTNCNTNSTYSDGTTYDHKDDKPMFQFEIDPVKMTAKVIVLFFNDTKNYRYIYNCNGNGATVTPTSYGYDITAEKIVTVSYYKQGSEETTDADREPDKRYYNIQNLNAKLDIFNNSLSATFTLGGSQVSTTGLVY